MTTVLAHLVPTGRPIPVAYICPTYGPLLCQLKLLTVDCQLSHAAGEAHRLPFSCVCGDKAQGGHASDKDVRLHVEGGHPSTHVLPNLFVVKAEKALVADPPSPDCVPGAAQRVHSADRLEDVGAVPQVESQLDKPGCQRQAEEVSYRVMRGRRDTDLLLFCVI